MKLKQEKIRPVRRRIAELGVTSLTSYTFQDNLLEFIFENEKEGDCVVEVGCFLGGLTAQLALIAQYIGKKLYVIDFYAPNIDRTRQIVQAIAPNAEVYYHFGTYDQFVSLFSGKIKPIVVFVDGDHTYEGVVKDIKSLYNMNPLPYAAAFHDFTLRGTETAGGYTAAVDEALYDTLGRDFIYRPMGGIAGKDPCIPDEHGPGEGGFYHRSGWPEAVLILCSECDLIDKSLSQKKARGVG